MKTWEYLIIPSLGDGIFHKVLSDDNYSWGIEGLDWSSGGCSIDEIGDQGWELISIIPFVGEMAGDDIQLFIYTFKREV